MWSYSRQQHRQNFMNICVTWFIVTPRLVHSTADSSANDVMVSHDIAKQCRQETNMLVSNKTATSHAQADCTGSSTKQGP